MLVGGDAILPLHASFAREFAQDWVDASNSHDLERILTHYDDEVLLVSPVALKLLSGDGTVRGKAALREYFLRAVGCCVASGRTTNSTFCVKMLP